MVEHVAHAFDEFRLVVSADQGLAPLLALTGALILTFTFIPAGVALILRGRVGERESPVVRGVKSVYAPALKLALRFRWSVIMGALVLVIACLALYSRMGSEFIPSLDRVKIDRATGFQGQQ